MRQVELDDSTAGMILQPFLDEEPGESLGEEPEYRSARLTARGSSKAEPRNGLAEGVAMEVDDRVLAGGRTGDDHQR